MLSSKIFVFMLPLALFAQGEWTIYSSRGIEVISNASERAARRTLNEIEQFRNAVGTMLGVQDAGSRWPIRVLVLKRSRDLTVPPSLRLARDAYVGGVIAESDLPALFRRDLTRILMDDNTGRMPTNIEKGLETLFTTLQIDGTRVTLGAPPPAPERDRDWARVHMLAVTPDYSGKLRVLLGNLQRGIPEDVAYRNAFGKLPAQIEREVDAYARGENFGTIPLSGLPLNPQRDFIEKPYSDLAAKIALADLTPSRAAYEAILKLESGAAAAHEGLGLMALREKQPEEARRHFAAAVEAGSRSAQAQLEAGNARQAAELNPKWAEPHIRLARDAPEPAQKIEHLTKATALDPRNSKLWKELAELFEAENRFADAAKAWAGAERAAASAEEREKLSQIRRENDQKRIEAAYAEKMRIAAEKQRELDQLRDEALTRIREAEEKANAGAAPREGKVEQWWTGPTASGRITGVLQQVECGKSQTRLIVQADGKTTRLLIRDPSKIVVQGTRQETLSCGPQRPPRPVAIDYFEKPDAKTATAGEAAVIEFR